MSNLTMSAVPACVLAGGLATRLRPVTERVPKALVEVAGRPFIDWQLELLASNGVGRAVLCVGHLGAMLADHVGDGSRFGLRVDYSFDGDVLRGTGGAVELALPRLADTFWVLYGDSYMDIDYPAVLRAFDASGADGLMTVLRNQGRWDTSNVIFRDGRLVKYSKRDRSADMEHIDYGVQLLRRAAVEPERRSEPWDLAGLYERMVAERRMIGYEVHQRFYEIGTPASLEEARLYLAGKPPGRLGTT